MFAKYTKLIVRDPSTGSLVQMLPEVKTANEVDAESSLPVSSSAVASWGEAFVRKGSESETISGDVTFEGRTTYSDDVAMSGHKIVDPSGIELSPSSNTDNNGGYIDFRYNNAEESTSRIIESASGTVTINNVNISNGSVSATTFTGALNGNATTTTKLATARTINGASFDGTGNITTTSWGTARNIYVSDSDGTNTGAAVSVNGSGNATLKLPATIKASITGNASGSSGSCTGNAATATKLATTRAINGTNFDGSAAITTANWGTARNISISDSDETNTGAAVSVNGSGNATLKLPATIKASITGNVSGSSGSCSGNAATATKLTTARSLWGNNFDGSAAISGTINGTPSIEFKPTATTSNNGGYLDFHYNQSTADYTSRIIESASGTLSINNVTITTGKVVTATTFTGALSGNASTATKFASAQSVTLTGAITGTASSQAGWSVGTIWRSCMVGQSGSTNTNPWYKVASFAVTTANDDIIATFLVEDTYSSHKQGILKVHVRTDGSKVKSSTASDLIWLSHTGFTLADFVLVCPTAASSTVEIWTKIATAYMYRRFTVLSEGSRSSTSIRWTLLNASSAGQEASITTTGTQIASTFAGQAASCTGNAATATKLATTRAINGTNFDGSAAITTANWGTARNIYIADSDATNTGAAVSINGSANATLKLPATIKASITGNCSGSSGSCTGNAATATKTTATIAVDTTGELVRATMGSNDVFRIAVGGASNAGWAELATGDDYNEPIYVRQYQGSFATLKRTATLLDVSGNTSFPGTVTAIGFSGPLTGNVTGNCSGSSASCTGNAATATKLATARTINVQDSSATNTGTAASFDGSANVTIKLPATIKASITGNCSGSSGSCTGNAATATKLATARTINGVSFDGSANITVADSTKVAKAGDTMTGQLTMGSSQAIHFKNTNITRGTAPSASQYPFYLLLKDSADKTLAGVYYEYLTDKSAKSHLMCYQGTTNANTWHSIGAGYDASGNPYTWARTPGFGNNSTQIATTAFVYNNAAKHLAAATSIYVAKAATGNGSGSNTSNYMSLADLRNYLATVHMHSSTADLNGAYNLQILFKAGDSFGNATFDATKMPGVRNLILNTSTGTNSTTSNYSTNSPTFGNIYVSGDISVTIRNINCTGRISAQWGAYISIDTYVAASSFSAVNNGYLNVAKNMTIDVCDAHTDYLFNASTNGIIAMWPGATITMNFRQQCYYTRALFTASTNGTMWLGYSSLKLTGTQPIAVWGGSGTLTGTSSTAAGTAAKAVTLASGQTFTLKTNATAKVKFTIDNTAANPTLNINSTGAKPIWWNGAAVAANMLMKNITYDVKYDGTHFVIQNAVKRLTNNDFGIFRYAGNYNQTYNSGSWNFTGWNLYYGTGVENGNWRGSHIGNIQQNVTTSDNTFPILFSGTANATANTSTYPYFGSGVKINPKTSTIYATTFSGTLSGNAATATKLGTSTVGSASMPIYLNGGTATACSYSFSGNHSNLTKGTNPSSTVWTHSWIRFDKSGTDTKNRLTEQRSFVNSSGVTGFEIGAYDYRAKQTGSGWIGIYDNNGTVYTAAPTPAAADNSTKIATTAWVRGRLHISTADPSGGTDGDIWFKYA